MAQNPSEGKLIYHITHINNLPSILKVGLLSRKKLLRNPSLSFTDIADSEILSKREQYKEALSQYVSNKNAADEILKMQNAYLIKDKIRVMSTMFPQGR